VLKAAPEARLVIAGAGSEEKNLLRLVDELGIGHSVHMLGSISKQQVAELMAAGDIFVLPSSLEAFGLAALEAAATGTAVVCSNAGGIPEVFQDGVNALLYSPGNTADMAGAMVRMIQDQELRRQLSASGAIVAHQLTWEVCANRTIRIYEEALHDYQSRRLHR
jgi:glycogen(starch) synthase